MMVCGNGLACRLRIGWRPPFGHCAIKSSMAVGDGDGAHRRRQFAAVPAPVDEGLVDGDGRTGSQRRDPALLLDRITVLLVTRWPPHAVVCACRRVGGFDDDPHQEVVAGLARHLKKPAVTPRAEEHALAGAATSMVAREPGLRREAGQTASDFRTALIAARGFPEVAAASAATTPPAFVDRTFGGIQPAGFGTRSTSPSCAGTTRVGSARGVQMHLRRRRFRCRPASRSGGWCRP